MEAKDQSPGPATSARKKLPYSLRSASKPKDENSAMVEKSSTSSIKRGKTASNVSKSVSVLDISGKDKSAKPPRRLSIPAKSSISSLPRLVGTITPISENRVKKSGIDKAKSDTPVSDVSKATSRRKFSVLSSVSYWISQIKLSESAAKHSISLGFFKLALESGCEPLQQLRYMLKSYVRQHNLLELGEPTKEVLRSYNISEDLEQVQVSEICSVVLNPTDEDGYSPSITRAGNLKPKSLNSGNTPASIVAETDKNESVQNVQKRITVAVAKNRASVNRSSSNLSLVAGNNKSNLHKKSQRPKQESNTEKKDKNSKTKSTSENDSSDPLPLEKTQQDDKENMSTPELEEISLTVQTLTL
ncbi:uncharacterized protein LOC143892087 [Tasmannia lanceolata]|uniref:uncharacterized protein LOC143892087 n=1 Tax=Tasmannia lanceolata TaxID=3420 RepID=UPI0040631675